MILNHVYIYNIHILFQDAHQVSENKKKKLL